MALAQKMAQNIPPVMSVTVLALQDTLKTQCLVQWFVQALVEVVTEQES